MSLHYLGKPEPGNCVFSVRHRHVFTHILLQNVGGSEQNRSVIANVQSDDLWPSRMHAATHILQEKTHVTSVSFFWDTVYCKATCMVVFFFSGWNHRSEIACCWSWFWVPRSWSLSWCWNFDGRKRRSRCVVDCRQVFLNTMTRHWCRGYMNECHKSEVADFCCLYLCILPVRSTNYHA